MVRFVVFDLFNTLIHGADQDRNRVVAQMAGLVGVEPAALVAAYADTWRQRQTEWGVEQTIDILARRLGGSPSQAQLAQAAELRRAFGRTVLATSTAIPVLDSLRAAGYRLGLVSNATSDAAEAWPGSALASRFSVAVFSCDVGLVKPDPRIYLAATTALGADPADCCYVGDGADAELAGATALGMTVYRTTEHADNDPRWPGASIASLAELVPLLTASER